MIIRCSMTHQRIAGYMKFITTYYGIKVYSLSSTAELCQMDRSIQYNYRVDINISILGFKLMGTWFYRILRRWEILQR